MQMVNNETRLNEVEEALILFGAILTGQPEDATPEEKESAVRRYAELMQGMTDRMLKRKESKF